MQDILGRISKKISKDKKSSPPELKVGDTVTIHVQGKVIAVADGHGLSYRVELPEYDYALPRRIWLNPDEIV